MLEQGLYEQLLFKALAAQIECSNEIDINKKSDKQDWDDSKKFVHEVSKLDKAEASKVIARYLAEVIEKGLSYVSGEKNSVDKQISIANKIINTMASETREESLNEGEVSTQAKLLYSFFNTKNNIVALNKKAATIRPESSMAQSSLFTGAVHEPQMFTELKKEIASCDRIDMLVSFIKWSGLRLLINELKQFTENGGELRVITTSYMGATDVKAVEELCKLQNTSIKVSYETKSTRLHAKAYCFYRKTGFTTAYVGSSNMSNAALSSGLEWNVKISAKDQPETIDKIDATFDYYWNSNDFEIYNEGQKSRLDKALRSEKTYEQTSDNPYIFNITPYAYQQEILDKLQAEREIRGFFHNLVVSATGTGKTVVAAFDYSRFKKDSKKPCRLLFIAHREEILKQSRSTFRGVLKDNNFGELFVGKFKPDKLDHLFMSIQSFNASNFMNVTSNDYYDYIVVDEFHHAAAPSYKKLLEYYKPKILLGLTATPERMDDKSILPYFNNRIAAEIRLPEAINRKLLCPFQYFGVSDKIDLQSLKWTRGGYDRKELSNIYTISGVKAENRARDIARALIKYVNKIEDVKALGFCVSVEHANFMAKMFNQFKIPSISLTGTSKDDERSTAKQRLVKGEIKIIFVVDIYNEGVDIPEINTVLFLRPTESLTVFVQQLGRGLRLSEDKDCLTVLDFIGQAHRKYNYEQRFAALLSNTHNSVEKEIKKEFTALPKGCYIQLEKMAKKYILDNIKKNYSSKDGIIAKIASFEEDSGSELKLSNFLEYHNMDIRKVYKHKLSFSRLCVIADVMQDFSDPDEELLTKALKYLIYLDSIQFIDFIKLLLEHNISNEQVNNFTAIEKRMLEMFLLTVYQKTAEECGFNNNFEAIEQLKNNKTMCSEMLEILNYKHSMIDFVEKKTDIGFDCPLNLYCSYSLKQILPAFDFTNISAFREGVKYFSDKKTELLFVTLNKADKDYSPTTMYNDYSISSTLFHWQSQSTASQTSAAGKRYINHKQMGVKILLFVREYKTDKLTAVAENYTYLGTANYMNHKGEKPMNILWKLDNPIPAKFLQKTNKMVIS